MGAVSHFSAIKLAYFRGHLTAGMLVDDCRRGAMMSVGMGEGQIKPYLE